MNENCKDMDERIREGKDHLAYVKIKSYFGSKGMQASNLLNEKAQSVYV